MLSTFCVYRVFCGPIWRTRWCIAATGQNHRKIVCLQLFWPWHCITAHLHKCKHSKNQFILFIYNTHTFSCLFWERLQWLHFWVWFNRICFELPTHFTPMCKQLFHCYRDSVHLAVQLSSKCSSLRSIDVYPRKNVLRLYFCIWLQHYLHWKSSTSINWIYEYKYVENI